MHKFFLMSLTLWLPYMLACSAGRNESAPKHVSYPIASQTERADVLADSRWALLGFGYTIAYADPTRNYEALRTDWRVLPQTFVSEQGAEQSVELRDRAVVHLSPRSVPSARGAQVASRIEFFMQTQSADRKKWIDIPLDPAVQEQYRSLVQDIQDRLRHRGYQF